MTNKKDQVTTNTIGCKIVEMLYVCPQREGGHHQLSIVFTVSGTCTIYSSGVPQSSVSGTPDDLSYVSVGQTPKVK